LILSFDKEQAQWFLINFFQLDLALKDEKGGDISSFITNGEWDLIGKHNFKILQKQGYNHYK